MNWVGPAAPPSPALSRRRRLAFHITALLLPFAVFGLGEAVCRLCGFGVYPHVLQRVATDGNRVWYGTNRQGTDTFFDIRRSVGGGMRELQFITPKPPNTVRIVLLGESAIQGFPQPLPLTNGSFLEAMLRDLWGGKRQVEVLNLGATAVGSFPVTCFLDEVLQHEPDLVVIMTGSNEFYGAYGVVSLRGLGRTPAGMRATRWIRKLGLTQWLDTVLRPTSAQRGTLMERLAVDRQIGRDDPLRRAAATSLRAHLTAMVRRCTSRRVPVIVCTVPTNERGLAPIGVDVEPALPPGTRSVFHDRLASAEQALTANPGDTAQLARESLRLWDQSARAHFILGQALTELGVHAEARDEYVKARDLDTMPWRATSAAQEIAHAAAAAAANAGAVLCDMEAAFRAASPGGAIGWELMDDHVHMSLRGQALFASTIASTLTSMPEPLHVERGDLDGLAGWDSYAQRLGHSVYSDYLAATHLRTLFDIPFMRRGNPAALERYDGLCRSLIAGMSQIDSTAVERWHDPTLHGATERPVEFVVGLYRMAAGDYAAAAPLFQVAQMSVPVLSLWSLELTWRQLTCNRHLHEEPTPQDGQLAQQAIRIGDLLARNNGAGNPQLLRYLGLAYNLVGDHASAIACLEKVVRTESGGEGWEVVAALADSYQQLGQTDAARGVLSRATQDPAMATAAQQMLQRIEGGGTTAGGDSGRR